MLVKQNIKDFNKNLTEAVTLVAVSKTKPLADIQEAYEAGQRVFGENKIQEMVNKYEALPKDIQWHMIGHLQSNKVKYMAHFVDLIHGVDSIKTLREIDKQAKKNGRIINCLIQAKIAKEETKFGMSFDEIESFMTSSEKQELKNISIVGLMGMASFSSNEKEVSDEFKNLKTFFDALNTSGCQLSILSMGMSGDYQLAIDNGSTMIRVGSAIFGSRNYIV